MPYRCITGPLFFEIRKAGVFFKDPQYLSLITVSYYSNNVKLNVSLILSDTISVDTIGHRFLGSLNIVTVSADRGIKTFYVEYPPKIGTTDTLYLDYSRTQATGCLYAFNQPLTLNNKSIQVDSLISLPDSDPLHIFEKP